MFTDLPFQRYCVKCMILWINLWIHRLIHLYFLIFLKGLIFSLWLWLSHKKKYITVFLVVCFLWCVLSHQGDYPEIHFYQNFLKTPLIWLWNWGLVGLYWKSAWKGKVIGQIYVSSLPNYWHLANSIEKSCQLFEFFIKKC